MTEIKSVTVNDVSLEKLNSYEYNNRVHSDGHVERIAESIRQFGYNSEIVVDESFNILCGHGRFLALKRLGWETASVKMVKGLSEAKKRLYRIVDNKLDTEAGWDFEAIRHELEFIELDDIRDWKLDSLSFDSATDELQLDLERDPTGEVDLNHDQFDSKITIRLKQEDRGKALELVKVALKNIMVELI